MLIPLICLGFAGTVFALATVMLGNRSDVSRRVAEVEDTATVHTHHHTNADREASTLRRRQDGDRG